MATTKGPLMSFDASGTIGGAITFSKWKGRNYVRRHAIPSNPKSNSQLATRAMMRALSKSWPEAEIAASAYWTTLGQSLNISPSNAFVQYNMKRWTQFQTPTLDPAHAVGTNPVLGALTLTAGVSQFSLSQVITTENDAGYLYVAVSQTTGFTPGKTDVRYITKFSPTPIVVIINGLAAGTYYVRTAGSTWWGSNLTAWVAQQSVVVT